VHTYIGDYGPGRLEVCCVCMSVCLCVCAHARAHCRLYVHVNLCERVRALVYLFVCV
jgi:hypothetical protein